jgi:hypothetical protein
MNMKSQGGFQEKALCYQGDSAWLQIIYFKANLQYFKANLQPMIQQIPPCHSSNARLYLIPTQHPI